MLRGPQGTLFGKNTTAGAINVTSRRPSFTPEATSSSRTAATTSCRRRRRSPGRCSDKVAGRLSFSGTRREGFVYNTTTQADDRTTLNNLGFRGPGAGRAVEERSWSTSSVDHTRQRPDGYAQVVAGVAPTLRPANRQYAQIAADLGYTPPSYNAFDRLTDTDTPLAVQPGSRRRLGQRRLDRRPRPADVDDGVALLELGPVERSRLHRPAGDDDLGRAVEAAAVDAGSPLRRGDLSPRLNVVAGVFAFRQAIDSNPSFKQEQGSAAARFLLAPSAAAATPGLLDGYGYNQYLGVPQHVSAALFGQLEWSVTDRLRLLPGLRFNYDQKDVDFDQQVYGGLQTTNPALIALQRSVLAPQAYTADVDDTNTSGQLTVAYQVSPIASTPTRPMPPASSRSA